MTEPMDVDKALKTIDGLVRELFRDEYSDRTDNAISDRIDALRARLRREREGIEKVRDDAREKAAQSIKKRSVAYPEAHDLLDLAAALDAILRGEGTT